MSAGHDGSRKTQKGWRGVDGRGDLISIGSISGGEQAECGVTSTE